MVGDGKKKNRPKGEQMEGWKEERKGMGIVHTGRVEGVEELIQQEEMG